MNRKPALSTENVFATVAVFLALAGGSVAIAAIPDEDSVDTTHVIDDSLRSEDLKDGDGVKSRDVRLDSLRAADLAIGSVGANEIAGDAVRASDIASAQVAGVDIADLAVDSSEIAVDAVGSSEIVASAVLSNIVLDGTVTGADIGEGGVAAAEIGDENIFRTEVDGFDFEDGDGARNADYAFDVVTADCGRGYGELLYGYASWADDGNPAAGNELVISEVRLNMTTEEVTVIGGSDDGSQGIDSFHVLEAHAVCLGD